MHADHEPGHTPEAAPAAVSRRRALALLGLGAAAGLLAACQGAGSASAPAPTTGTTAGNGSRGGSPAPARSPQAAPGKTSSFEITVTNWPSLLYAPPFMVAQEKGYFRDEGITISNIVGSAGGGTTVRNVVTGGLPFGEVATTAAVQAYDAGAPLTIVGGGVQRVAEIYWVVMGNSPLQKITDLKGKSLGFTSPGSVTEGTANLSLKRADGIDPQDVERRPMGGVREGLTALKGGGIDTAAHLDPVYSVDKRKGEDFRILFKAGDYIQTFMQTVEVVGPGLLKENSNLIRGFLRARQRGIQYIGANLDEAAQIYGRDAKLPPEACLDALKAVDPKAYYAVGFDKAALDLVQENLQILGLYKANQQVAWKEIVNQDFLPEGVQKAALG